MDLSPVIRNIYDLWLDGRRNIGYTGHEGFRGRRGWYDDVVDKVNLLIQRKNKILDRLVDDINGNLTPDWIKVNNEYLIIHGQIKDLDAIIYNDHS